MLSRNRIPVLIFIFINIILLFEFVYFYPLLPEKMASHFNFSGNADSWSDKNTFFIIFICIYFVSVGLIFLLSLLLPKFPNSMINMPNKEKLLSPERREITLSYISGFLINICSLVALLFVVINYFAFDVNIHRRAGLPVNVIFIVVAFVVLINVFMFRMLKKLKS